MKNTAESDTKRRRTKDELRREYSFDYTKAQPNRFAGRRKSTQVVVLLDADVPRVFRNGEAVSTALRALLTALPKRLG